MPRIAFALFCAVALAACGSVKRIPVKALFHGQAIETTVDDESAKYYLEHHLAGARQIGPLQKRIDALQASLSEGVPTREQLKLLSKEFSVDLAALLFADRLLQQKGNAQLQEQFLQNLDKVRQGTVVYPKQNVLILLVPGYDYVSNGRQTGADLASPRKLLEGAGYQVQFVAINPLGSVEENAVYLAKDILSHKHRAMVVAGASSAGPAIHLALGKLLLPQDLKNMKAWLNLGGILQGVPVLDQVLAGGPKGWIFSTVLWFKGWRRSSFESMATAVSRVRFDSLKVPEHIAIYNYLGLALSGDISDFARDKYKLMRADGPNDGLTLLPDAVAPYSLSIIAPRSDHFFAEDPEIDKKTLALLVTIFERIKI